MAGIRSGLALICIAAAAVVSQCYVVTIPGAPSKFEACNCYDIPPPGTYTCEEQKGFGKCDRSWMVDFGYCELTCGRCKCSHDEFMEATVTAFSGSPVSNSNNECGDCADVAPNDDLTCEEQAAMGRCDLPFMEGFCMKSCDKCICDGIEAVNAHKPMAGSDDSTFARLSIGGNNCMSLVATIKSNPDLSALADAIRESDMETALDDKELAITFFAPTNAAFKEFEDLLGSEKAASGVLEDQKTMQFILSYHAVMPALKSENFTMEGVVPTLTGLIDEPTNLVIRQKYSGKIYVDGEVNHAAIQKKDIEACESVMHIVDAVLLPAFVSDKFDEN